jgi:hypothetical protein
MLNTMMMLFFTQNNFFHVFQFFRVIDTKIPENQDKFKKKLNQAQLLK